MNDEAWAAIPFYPIAFLLVVSLTYILSSSPSLSQWKIEMPDYRVVTKMTLQWWNTESDWIEHEYKLSNPIVIFSDCNYTSLTFIEIHKFYSACQHIHTVTVAGSQHRWQRHWYNSCKWYIYMYVWSHSLVYETCQRVKPQWESRFQIVSLPRKEKKKKKKKCESHKFSIVFYRKRGNEKYAFFFSLFLLSFGILKLSFVNISFFLLLLTWKKIP